MNEHSYKTAPKWFIWTCLFLQSNNHILLPAIRVELPPMLTLNNDSAESVQKAALNHFKASTFTSYTEVTPKDSVMLLVLEQKDNRAGETVTFSQYKIRLELSWLRVRNRNNALNVFFLPLNPDTIPSTRPAIPITTNAPDQMPFFMQLYTSADYRSPLDPNSKVQTDKRIYAEARNHAAPWLVSASITWIYCTFLIPILTDPCIFCVSCRFQGTL